MHLVIIVCIPCVYVRRMWCIRFIRSAPALPLCVFFEIVLDNPFGVLILYYPLSSAKLRIFICLTFLLHTTLVLSFHFSLRNVRQFCRFFGVDGNGWRIPRNLGRRLCPFCIRFLVIGHWNRVLTSFSQKLRSNLDQIWYVEFLGKGDKNCKFHNYIDTRHPFIMVIPKDPWHSHLMPCV